MERVNGVLKTQKFSFSAINLKKHKRINGNKFLTALRKKQRLPVHLLKLKIIFIAKSEKLLGKWIKCLKSADILLKLEVSSHIPSVKSAVKLRKLINIFKFLKVYYLRRFTQISMKKIKLLQWWKEYSKSIIPIHKKNNPRLPSAVIKNPQKPLIFLIFYLIKSKPTRVWKTLLICN